MNCMDALTWCVIAVYGSVVVGIWTFLIKLWRGDFMSETEWQSPEQLIKDARLGAMIRKLPKGFALVHQDFYGDIWEAGKSFDYEPGVKDEHYHDTPDEALECALKEAGIE